MGLRHDRRQINTGRRLAIKYLLDPSTDSDLTHTVFPRRSAFVFGHEEYGFSFDPQAYANLSKISIPQYGKVQSLNVSVAASLTMYEYVRQQRKSEPLES